MVLMKEAIKDLTRKTGNKEQTMNAKQFSVIVFLSYYDTTKMTVIDLQHNLLLGATKHGKIWFISMKIN